jgi:hypothetical protein
MSIADDMLDPTLAMLQEQGQVVTIRHHSGGTAGSDGGIAPAYADHSAYAVFGETSRHRTSLSGGAGRDVPTGREQAFIAAKGLTIAPRPGDGLFRASSATGREQRIEGVEAIQPGATVVLFRAELAR